MHAAVLPLAVNQSYDFEDDRPTHSLPAVTEEHKCQTMHSPRPLPSSQSGAAPYHNNKLSLVECSAHKDTDSLSAKNDNSKDGMHVSQEHVHPHVNTGN